MMFSFTIGMFVIKLFPANVLWSISLDVLALLSPVKDELFITPHCTFVALTRYIITVASTILYHVAHT